MGHYFIIIVIITLLIVGGAWIFKKFKEGGYIMPLVQPGLTGSRPPVKKALLVGINIYKPELGANLRGCVNDVENMRYVLTEMYGFSPDNLSMLIDDRATKAAIVERLEWLLNDCIPGDELVFHYSGHGSQVRDRHGDELDDGLDEILCPYDLNWDDPFTDDCLGDLFNQVPTGVFLTMICDACHSGTMTKELLCNNPRDVVAKFIMPPYDIRSRSIGMNLKVKVFGKEPEGQQNHVLLSGCKDNQTSADAYVDDKYQGALTWAVVSAIKDNPDATWKEMYATLLNKIKPGFDQDPQLSGNDPLLDRKVFGGR